MKNGKEATKFKCSFCQTHDKGPSVPFKWTNWKDKTIINIISSVSFIVSVIFFLYVSHFPSSAHFLKRYACNSVLFSARIFRWDCLSITPFPHRTYSFLASFLLPLLPLLPPPPSASIHFPSRLSLFYDSYHKQYFLLIFLQFLPFYSYLTKWKKKTPFFFCLSTAYIWLSLWTLGLCTQI